MLSDALGIPNLYQRSREHWQSFLKHRLFGVTITNPIALDRREGYWLLSYGLMSFAYRIFISLSIMMFIADQWRLLGLVLLLMFVWVWVIKPCAALCKLLSSASIVQQRQRAIGVSLCLLFLVGGIVSQIPLTRSMTMRGVVQREGVSWLHAPVGARLTELQVHSGQWVEVGDSLMTFDQQDVKFDLARLMAQKEEVAARLTKARESKSFQAKAFLQQQTLILQQIEFTKDRLDKTNIKAPRAGYFIAEQKDVLGLWFEEGDVMGRVVPKGELKFVTVASQEDAKHLFGVALGAAQIKILGRSHETYKAHDLNVIPYEEKRLPSAILGWKAGGDIPVRDDDPEGRETTEPFFRIQASLEPVDLQHQRSGWLRVSLPSQTLLEWAWLSLQQLLQRRYQL
jgi:putative peptide zinc metalloprotease protein